MELKAEIMKSGDVDLEEHGMFYPVGAPVLDVYLFHSILFEFCFDWIHSIQIPPLGVLYCTL